MSSHCVHSQTRLAVCHIPSPMTAVLWYLVKVVDGWKNCSLRSAALLALASYLHTHCLYHGHQILDYVEGLRNLVR